jgi:co-chaperonin GroES (HSP10)
MDNGNKYDIGIDLKNFSKDEEIKKFDGYKVPGWRIAVRLYVEVAMTKGGIILPESVHQDQQYKACVGLVVKQATAAYLDPRYEQTGKWCEVGDWAVFPRHAGTQVNYKGLPLMLLQEDSIIGIVDNPADVTK